MGDVPGARRHRDLGFRKDFLTALPYRGAGAPVRVLLLVSAMGGNTPTASLLDDSVFATTVLVADYYDAKIPLPPHDIVFNGIGDADICGNSLAAAAAIVAHTSRPVINDPRAVTENRAARQCRAAARHSKSRCAANRKSAAASSRRIGAAAETVAAHGLSLPLLVRAPGFHTGRHFVRAETADALAAAAESLSGR